MLSPPWVLDRLLSPMTYLLLDKTNSFLRAVTLFGIVEVSHMAFLQCPWTLMPLLAPTFRALIYNALWKLGRIKNFWAFSLTALTLELTSRFRSSLVLNLCPFQKLIQTLKKKSFGCMVSDTMTFTTASPFFQFETFLKGLHLESMKSAEIAARQMEAFPAEQFVTTPVYVLFL
jgi:hypothetical protein